MSEPVEQRWIKPSVYAVNPGHWKKQLPGKHLKLAARGKVADLERLLSDQPEALNQRGNHGRTLLWEACRKGRLEAIDYLLSKGADHQLTGCYNSESHVQLDCYSAARFYGRATVEKRLEREGVEPDLFRACFLGDRSRVEAMLAADPTCVNAEDPHDEIYRVPPVAFAVAGDQKVLIQNLVDADANIDCYSSLLIFLIGQLNRPQFLDPLIDAGLDVRATDSSTFLAAKSLDCLADLLDRGAPTDRPGHSGFPPLVHLCRPDKGDTFDKVALLLRHGANVNTVGPHGKTALHHAACGKRPEIVSLLVRSGADVHARDEEGASPLDLADQTGNEEILAILRN